MVVLYSWNHAWGFLPKNIIPKPASHLLCNSLAILVRHSQAQKYLQINPKPLTPSSCYEIFYVTEVYTN